MLGKSNAKKIRKISLTDDTVGIKIWHLLKDVYNILIEKLKTHGLRCQIRQPM
jgi:hypothetical protein